MVFVNILKTKNKMKELAIHLLILLSISSCSVQQTKNIEQVILTNKPMWIKSWVNDPLLNLRSDGWHSYDSSYSYIYTKIPVYESFYFYSPSKILFVDIYSRTIDIEVNENDTTIIYLDPESEIILSDTIKKTSDRLLFISEEFYFEDVIWVEDSYFIVLSSSSILDEIVPEILIFDITKKQQIHYKGIANKRSFNYLEKKFSNTPPVGRSVEK
jgi:hypothetical protein